MTTASVSSRVPKREKARTFRASFLPGPKRCTTCLASSCWWCTSRRWSGGPPRPIRSRDPSWSSRWCSRSEAIVLFEDSGAKKWWLTLLSCRQSLASLVASETWRGPASCGRLCSDFWGLRRTGRRTRTSRRSPSSPCKCRGPCLAGQGLEMF